MRLTAPGAEYTQPLPEVRWDYAQAPLHPIGVPFAGPGGHLYIRRVSDGHVVPYHDPNAGQNATVATTSGAPANVPAAPPGRAAPAQPPQPPGQGTKQPTAPTEPAPASAPKTPAPQQHTGTVMAKGIQSFLNSGNVPTEANLTWTANKLNALPEDELNQVADALGVRRSRDRDMTTNRILGTIKWNNLNVVPSTGFAGQQLRKLVADFFPFITDGELSKEELGKLGNATPNSTVKVRASSYKNAILITSKSATHRADRDIYFQGNDLVINNELFEVSKEEQGKGLGTSMFVDQVRQAKAMGVDYIKTHAARKDSDDPEEAMNGYYTWPRLGYDGDLGSQKSKLPEQFRTAQTIQDLYAMPGGKEWWREHGESIDLKFDLANGSRSMKVLEAYLKAKEEKKKKEVSGMRYARSVDETPSPGGDPQRRGDQPDLSPEDEEALEEAWRILTGTKPPPSSPEERLRYLYVTKQTIGQPFQTSSGRWYVRRSSDGHVVPSPTPGGAPSAQVGTPSGRVANVPAAPPLAGRPVAPSGAATSAAPVGAGTSVGTGAGPAPQAPVAGREPALSADIMGKGIAQFVTSGATATAGQLRWTVNQLQGKTNEELKSIASSLPEPDVHDMAIIKSIKDLFTRKTEQPILKEITPPPALPGKRELPVRNNSVGARRAIGAVHASINKQGHLSAETKELYTTAASNVLGAMPDAAIEHLGNGLKKMKWYTDMKALTVERNSGGRKPLPPGRVTGGFFARTDKSVHLDAGGPNDAGGLAVDEPYGTSPSVSNIKMTGVYSHELTHAIDHGLGQKHGTGQMYSNGQEWTRIWHEEMEGGSLNSYAASKPAEGWAEFGRLVYGTNIDRREIAGMFPKATALWKQLGLWNGA